jgi:hypothetical protein
MASRVSISSCYTVLHALINYLFRLPLDPVMLVITELSPKVQELRHRPSPTIAINDFLASASLKHVLPPVPPLNPRRFLVSQFILHKQ